MLKDLLTHRNTKYIVYPVMILQVLLVVGLFFNFLVDFRRFDIESALAVGFFGLLALAPILVLTSFKHKKDKD